MIREGDWKYIWLANGDREQLFNLVDDPDEIVNRAANGADIAAPLRCVAVQDIRDHGLAEVLRDDDLDWFLFRTCDRDRIYQLVSWKGVDGFPDDPGVVIDDWELQSLDEFTAER